MLNLYIYMFLFLFSGTSEADFYAQVKLEQIGTGFWWLNNLGSQECREATQKLPYRVYQQNLQLDVLPKHTVYINSLVFSKKACKNSVSISFDLKSELRGGKIWLKAYSAKKRKAFFYKNLSNQSKIEAIIPLPAWLDVFYIEIGIRKAKGEKGIEISNLNIEGVPKTVAFWKTEKAIYTLAEEKKLVFESNFRSPKRVQISIYKNGKLLHRNLKKRFKKVINSLKSGIYKIETTYLASGKLYKTAFDFVIVPGRVKPLQSSHFGTHVALTAKGLAMQQALGAGWLRLHGANVLKWKNVEAKQGKFVWNDSLLLQFLDKGFHVLPNLSKTPTWASLAPRAKSYPSKSFYFGAAAYAPREVHFWGNYVARLAKRYKNKIRYWEMWNEPDIHFFVAKNSKIDEYMPLYRAFQRNLKLESTENQIVAPCLAYFVHHDKLKADKRFPEGDFLKYRDTNFWQKLDNQQIKFDVFSFHNYSSKKKKLPSVKKLSKKLASVKKKYNTKIWLTEYNVMLGSPSFEGISEAETTQFVYEHFKLFAAGADKIFAYNLFNKLPHFDGSNNFFGFTGSPNRLFLAYAVLIDKINNFKKIQLLSSDNQADRFEISFKNGKLMQAYYVKSDISLNLQSRTLVHNQYGEQMPVKNGKILMKASNFYYIYMN